MTSAIFRAWIRTFRRLPIVTVGLASVAFTACKTAPPQKHPLVNYAAYERVPDMPSSLAWRYFFKSLPYIGTHAFHGNYGGCGNRGGKPIDSVDALCRKHDIFYAEAQSLPFLRMADRIYAEELKRLDESKLSPKALAFRRRAINFMSHNGADWIGKPRACLKCTEENPHSPFQSEEMVRKFYRCPEGEVEMKLLQWRDEPVKPGKLTATAKARSKN